MEKENFLTYRPVTSRVWEWPQLDGMDTTVSCWISNSVYSVLSCPVRKKEKNTGHTRNDFFILKEREGGGVEFETRKPKKEETHTVCFDVNVPFVQLHSQQLSVLERQLDLKKKNS